MDEVILKLLGLLQQLTDERGVPASENLINSNIIASDNSPLSNKDKPSATLSSRERKRLEDGATIFSKVFFDYKKRIDAESAGKTLISNIADKQKAAQNPPVKTAPKAGGGLGWMATVGLLALASLAALVYGLMTDGPLKGLMKILGGLGIKSTIKLIASKVGSLIKFAKDIIKKPLNIISNIGKAIFGDSFKLLIEGVQDFFKGFGKGVGGTLSKLIPSGLKGGGGVIGKLLGGIVKFLKPALKVFKRIPVLGTLISVGFAISRFKSGDTIGGIIDVLSGLAGLIDIAVPGLGTTLSIGLDMLNAFLDIKAGGANAGAQQAKGDILMGMAKKLGGWMWNNADYIPLLGTFKRWGMSMDSFKSGKWGDGLKQLGYGIMELAGPVGGMMVNGIEMLLGWFNSKSTSGGELKENTSWLSSMKKWMIEKLQNLPYFLRKPLEWMGILPSSTNDNTVIDDAAKQSKDGAGGLISFISSLWEAITSPFKFLFDKIGEYTKKVLELVPDVAKKTAKAVVKTEQKVENTLSGWISDAIVGSTPPMGKQSSPKTGETPKTPTPATNTGGMVDMTPKTPTPATNTGGMVDMTPKTPTPATNTGGRISELSKTEFPSTKLLHNISRASFDQIKLLSALVNIGTSTLQELKRMSGNNSGGGGTQVIQSPTPTEKTQKISVDNMRGGYASSVYALS